MGSERADGGPPAWAIVAGTVLAALVVVAVVVGYSAWRDRDGDDAPGADVTATTAGVDTTVLPDAGAARLFTRTTPAGVEVRVDSMAAGGRGDIGMFGPVGGGGDDLPPFCRVVDQLLVYAINAASVLQGGLPLTEAAPPEPVPVALWAGPDSTLVGVALQVDPDVASVRLAAPGAVTDEMEPIDGVVALVVETTLGPMEPEDRFGMPDFGSLVVTVRRQDGTTDVVRPDADRGPPVWMGDPDCMDGAPNDPPPTIDPEHDPFAVRLPPAGTEQPADPAEAQAAIEGAFAALYAPADPAVDVLTYVDDPFAMRETFADAQENPMWEGSGFEEADVTIEGIVFVSATEAAFDYALQGPNIDHGELFGRARLVDGTWRLTRGTVCRDLRLAMGHECPP